MNGEDEDVPHYIEILKGRDGRDGRDQDLGEFQELMV